MEPNQSQQPKSQLNPHEVSVGLAQFTHLLSQGLPPPTTPAQEPGTTQQPGQEQNVKAEISGLESRLMDELATLREEMKSQGDGKAELADLKKQIEAILASND